MPALRVKPASLVRRGLQVMVFNTAIAVGLTVFGNEGFARNLLYSQCIGLCIWLAIDGGQALLVHDWATQWRRIVAIAPAGGVLGFVVGTGLGDAALGRAPLVGWATDPRQTLGLLALSLLAGTAATYVFASREHASQARAREETLRREALEARLRLLESQLEPHMLFNTLANLRALIGLDAGRAQAMLDDLVAYLRSTLSASRASMHPLADEFARIDDYLSLMAVRMGPRLRRELRLPDELAQHPVPTLLLQPLVENSVLHGLEPRVEGGALCVSASVQGAALRLMVHDTGVGLATPSQAEAGFGLVAVRERLRTVYGDAARLELQAAPGGGTCAIIELPLSLS